MQKHIWQLYKAPFLLYLFVCLFLTLLSLNLENLQKYHRFITEYSMKLKNALNLSFATDVSFLGNTKTISFCLEV